MAPKRTAVCVVVHIPHQLDYYAHKLDVLKLSLASLAAHTPREQYDLMVFDNASCTGVSEYLRGLVVSGDIDHLLVSARNIGKLAASRMLFDAAASELVAYADDDVWFGPGWLEAHLAVIDTYPRVGMVSGRPVRKQFAYGNTYLPGYLEAFPGIAARAGHLIPEDWEREYLRSIGRIYRSAVAQVAAQHEDVLLEYQGVPAYSTAAHFQFVAPKPVILEALAACDASWTGGEERQFEEAMDRMGYARLSTAERHVRHIGNLIPPELRDEAARSGVTVRGEAVWQPPSRRLVKLLKRWPFRPLLERLNHWTYLFLHHP